MLYNEVFPTFESSAETVIVFIGSSPDSNGERSCAKQQRRPMIQKEQTKLIG